jgi:hypothetical protein
VEERTEDLIAVADDDDAAAAECVYVCVCVCVVCVVCIRVRYAARMFVYLRASLPRGGYQEE